MASIWPLSRGCVLISAIISVNYIRSIAPYNENGSTWELCINLRNGKEYVQIYDCISRAAAACNDIIKLMIAEEKDDVR